MKMKFENLALCDTVTGRNWKLLIVFTCGMAILVKNLFLKELKFQRMA